MANYLHGYDSQEQQRLIDQAGFLGPLIYPFVDYSGCKKLLEVGSGVGAQTAVLLGLFPELQITSVDYSEAQLAKARENLAAYSDRVRFVSQDAQELDLGEKFDSAFFCWALEHIPDPQVVMHRVKAHLVPGAKIHLTEVFNSTFYYEPELPALTHYYRVYNQQQRDFGGNPDVGAQLGNLLAHAGFREIELSRSGFHLDQSQPEELRRFVEFWKILMKSGAPGLIESGLLRPDEVKAMETDLDRLLEDENAVFFYQFVQAKATV
ncbi:methyltransferase [Algoriphagus sp. H41]|uniref:Methyltransferase n=1 Tax=Algoriphagus oliviformis TaxID=2811231 RepID=A0ABS3C072_9BACT|nr:class I SAM-dependent methyltransferase [Algoriphagus oliviformis]MBN7809590.1 methyltransferase [Algoriphagus oliviformis]